jgi:hypothetical protein
MRYVELREASVAVPTRSFPKLFHVGTLNIADKQRGSYEGAGLSVSLHPEEWMQIARIGGPIWKCVRPGNRFIDFYRLRKAHKTMIADWAIEHGWATRTSLWRVYFFDVDMEERRYFEFTDPDEAQQEADDLETQGQQPQPPTIKEVKGGLMGTPTLYDRMMQRTSESVGVGDFVAIVYAEDVLKIDGVWFNERLDPYALSAPRGVIVPSMVSQWRFTKLP